MYQMEETPRCAVSSQIPISSDIPPRLPHEEIPLNMEIPPMSIEKQKWYELFRKYDTNNDDRLSLSDLKIMIRNHRCTELPQNMTRKILKLTDTDSDGFLDFEEFYRLSQTHRWIFKDFLIAYCRHIVPSPHRIQGDELDGAYEREMSVCPPPLTMVVFSLIEVLAFIIDVAYWGDHLEDGKKIGESTEGPAATLFIYNPYKRYETWRFATYMLVHVGIMHLMMNLLIQLLLGVALELVHHWWRVTLVYLAGVIAGSMGTSLITPRIFLAGASGGVYALITAHIATIILPWAPTKVKQLMQHRLTALQFSRQPQEANAVGQCKLPSFCRARLELWFFQKESQFQVAKVYSDASKYHLIVAALDHDVIADVSDIVRSPPYLQKYEAIKSAILARLTDSPDIQLYKLLTGVELGDKRPSQLLRHMRILAGTRAGDDVLRVKWLDLLPPQTRRMLLLIKNQSLEELVADEAHELGPSVMATSAYAAPHQPSQIAQEFAALRLAIVQRTSLTHDTFHQPGNSIM